MTDSRVWRTTADPGAACVRFLPQALMPPDVSVPEARWCASQQDRKLGVRWLRVRQTALSETGSFLPTSSECSGLEWAAVPALSLKSLTHQQDHTQYTVLYDTIFELLCYRMKVNDTGQPRQTHISPIGQSIRDYLPRPITMHAFQLKVVVATLCQP